MRVLFLVAAVASLLGASQAVAADWAGLTAALPPSHALIVERGGVRLFADIPLAPDRGEPRWRWASQTKQVMAVLVMQQVAAGRIALDTPVAHYLPHWAAPNAAMITVRQLLRHQSGLPNPDDVAATAAAPSGYYAHSARQDPLTYCGGAPKASPGGSWAYNNCDYLVLAEVLRAVTGQDWERLVASRIAAPLHLRSVGVRGGDHLPAGRLTVGSAPEERALPDLAITRYGAAASLSGTPSDLVAFDRGLLAGKLLPAKVRDEMWDGQPQLGFIALGQWVFTAPLKGCAAPVRIVERRGAIGGMQLRNFILPDLGVIAVAFVGNDTFDFGEVWQGAGFAHDLLASAACP